MSFDEHYQQLLPKDSWILCSADTALSSKILAKPLMKSALNSFMISWTLRHSLLENHWRDLVFSVVEDLFECMEPKELSAITEEPAFLFFRPCIRPGKKTYCLAAVTKTYPALNLTPQLAEQLLSYFETVRPSTEVFFHSIQSPWSHWLYKDVRRLRLHFLPNYTFGKGAMFNRVPH